MKKMRFTKLLLTLMIAFIGVGSANAIDVHATISSATTGGSATWVQVGETSTYTYTWTDTGDSRNDYISLFDAFKTGDETELDWSDGTNFIFTCAGPTASQTNALNVIIVANGGEFSRAMYSDGTKTLTLTATSGDGFKNGDAYITANDLEHVTDIRLQATNKHGFTLTTGSVNVSNVYVQLSHKTSVTFNASGVATVNLADIDVTGDVTYDPVTNIVTSIGGSGSFRLNFNKADFTNLTKIALSATTSGTVSEKALSDILGTTSVQDNKNGTLVTWSSSRWNYDFSSFKVNAGQVISITFNVNTSGSMKINSITLTADAMQLSNPNSLNVAGPYAKWTDVTSTAVIAEAATPYWNVGSATGTVYGDVNVNSLYYADLKNFKTMKIYVNASSNIIRAMFNRAAGNGAFFNVQVNPSNGELTEASYSSYADGVFTIDLAKILAEKETVHLNAIKAAAGQSNAYVDKVILEPITPNPYDYVLSGQYSSATDISEFTSDASATAIDCSSLSGNNISLSSANPNCMFVARDGVLSNANNVIVKGTPNTCANLVLEDNHPFKAPADFTATAASYTTTITAAGAGTLCLPFAATVPGEVTAWTLTYTSGDAATAKPVETTIPANTPVLLNGSGSKTFSGSGAVSASATNVSGALTGVFATSTVPVNSYVLQKQDANVGFFKVTGAKIINPFRAYLTASGNAPSLSIIFPEDNDVTGISEIEKMRNADNVTIFDLQGRKVAQPQKGLYIVNGKKVIFK